MAIADRYRSGRPALPALQLPFDRLADQVGSLLAFLQRCINARQRAGREPGRGLFVVDLSTSHDPKINDIRYVDKTKIPDIIYPIERETDMTLEAAEKLATKNKPAIILIDGIEFEVRRIVKSKHRRFSYRHGERNMGRDEAERLLPAKCTCLANECDCQAFPSHVSMECPIHNDNPMPADTCPLHGTSSAIAQTERCR